MLQWINDRMKVFGWLIIAPIIVVFVFWGVQGIVSFSARQDKGLSVDGKEIPTEEVRTAYQRQLAQLSRLYPEELPVPVRTDLQQRLVDEFVNTSLITQKTDAEKYAVTDQDVTNSILKEPAFQVGGKFDRDTYDGLLRERGYTPTRFEAEQRALLKSRALESGLFVSAFATPTDLVRAAALKGETREAGYAVLPLKKYLPAAKAEEAAIAAYYEAHKASYQTPETVRLAYVELTVAELAKDVVVDEPTLKAYYDTVKDRYLEPERRRARHIVVQVAGDEAAGKKKAEALLAQVEKPGADFAAIAKAESQDAGSAPIGGDLGFVERSFLSKSLGDAIFTMKAGEIVGPVKSEFGWHVIRLEEIQPSAGRKFEDVRAELEAEYRKSEAEKRFGEKQEKIEQLAFEQNDTLAPVAKALGLSMKEIPEFHRGLAGNPLAANPKVVQAAFSAEVIGGQNSKAIEVTPGTVVVIRSAEHKLPVEQPLSAVRAQVAETVKHDAALATAKSVGESLAKALAGGTAWDVALKPLGAVAPATPVDGKTVAPDAILLAPPKYLARAEPGVEREILAAIFGAAGPAAGRRTTGAVALASGDVAVFALTQVKPGVLTGEGAEERRAVEAAAAEADFSTYLSALRSHAEIHYSPAIFE